MSCRPCLRYNIHNNSVPLPRFFCSKTVQVIDSAGLSGFFGLLSSKISKGFHVFFNELRTIKNRPCGTGRLADFSTIYSLTGWDNSQTALEPFFTTKPTRQRALGAQRIVRWHRGYVHANSHPMSDSALLHSIENLHSQPPCGIPSRHSRPSCVSSSYRPYILCCLYGKFARFRKMPCLWCNMRA